MRSFPRSLAVLFTLITTAVNAQGQGAGTEFPLDVLLPITILADKAQEELKLSADQISRLPEFRLSVYKRSDIAHVPSDDLEVRILALRALQPIIDKELSGFLTPEQHKRLRQICLQVSAAVNWGQLLRSREIAPLLSITDAQREMITDLRKKHHQEFLRSAGPAASSPVRRGELSKRQNDDFKALLTDEQKAKWLELTGIEFKDASRLSRR